MMASFGYEFVSAAPAAGPMFSGLFLPECPDCGHPQLLQAVGVIGAIIMPHNLYLHSALVKSRAIDTNNKKKVREANMYYFIEAAIALGVSLVINVFIVSVFAEGLYKKTNNDIRSLCGNSSEADRFPANDELVDADLYKGGIFLGCQYGPAAMYIWAIGVLAAGQSSTMTGTYAGQFAMEGFLNLQWKKWMRVLFTRTIAVLPTFFIAFYEDIQSLSGMNDLLNCLMSLMLPFAVIPTITFTSNKKIMGDFANGFVSRVFSVLLSLLVIAVNTYFVLTYVIDLGITNAAFIIFLVLFGLAYLLFCLYLTIDMMLAMGHARLASLPLVQKLFSVSTTQGNYSIHADEDEEDSNSSELSDVEGGDEEVSQRPDGN